jgi:quinol monooxygenase YgiN
LNIGKKNKYHFHSSSITHSSSIALIVNVEIAPNRIEEFLDTIIKDAKGSINNEDGNCLRFDVLRDLNFPNKFVFYEVYKDEESIKKHKLTPHFALWSNFKNSGGVLSQSVTKASTVVFDYSAQKEHESQIWSIDQWKSWN